MSNDSMTHLIRAWVTGDECPICHKPIIRGQEVYLHTREQYPYKLEDAEDQDYEVFEWHKDCDPGTLAAEEAEIPDWAPKQPK